ncbi:WD40 repeat-like protein [Hyaloscypha bicolor E]|uniref:WD40 repeat-like protein n=1 Tax=Hyaloscypha bicolor E TaxID=1095630 RepID=A0A2J6SFC5_9HELO|nr:WD40 repeat-like protein [Hyaloscypha bicolor E]PMD49456.1 WD40 repeat-like protein [Hyaloscypha bicolor E]
MLPEDPAFNFVSYARSANLLEPCPPLVQLSNDTSTSWAQDDNSSLGSWDSFETVVPGRTSILKSAFIAKYFAREGEKAHTPPPPPPPRRFSYLGKALDHPENYAKIDQYGPLGLNTLFDPSKPAIADLVFVHGLGGGSKKTWMKENNPSSFWPQEWLPKDDSFQNVRIHSFGYNSNWRNKENVLTIQDFAKALLADIQNCPRIPRGSHVSHSFQSILTINDEFSRYCQHLKIYSCYETLPASLGLTRTIVVEKDQAVLGCANERSTFLNTDHRRMCEFEAISDPNYQTVRDVLASAVADLYNHDARWRQELKECQQSRLDEVLGVTTAVEHDFIEIDRLRTPGTCQWLIEKQSFREWQDCPKGTQIYWMNARPATGKTVLSGKVIAHLKSVGLDCSYHFFKNGNKSNRSAIRSFLLSMAWQMSRASPEVLSKVLGICEKYDQLSKADYQILWRKLFLGGILWTRSQAPRYWVIDALDECMSGNELLRVLLKIPEGANLRIFVTSRKKIELKGIPFSPSLNIKSEEILVEDTRSDIKLYLDANFDQLPVSDQQTRQDLVALILEKSDGCFLWVSLVLRELRMVHTISDVQEVLAAVPTDMGVLYSRILDTLSETRRGEELVKSVLRWTVCSARPLKTDELSHALQFDLNDNINAVESVISMCGQLVFIDSQSRVRIVHQTARQFLLRPDIDSVFAINKEFAHTRILLACMKYLTSDEIRGPSARKRSGSKSLLELCSFAEYACTMFFQHLSFASSADDQIALILARFLSSTNVLMWITYVAAQQSNLNLLIETAKALKQYFQRRSKHQSSFGKEFVIIDAWSTDLVCLVSHFGTCLLASPSSIFTLIPPLCPADSALRKQFGSTGRGISILGLSARAWGDCLSTVIEPHDQYAALAVSKTQFAIGMASGKITIYDQTTCQQLRTLKHQEAVGVLKFDNAAGTLVSAGTSFVHVWDVTSGKKLWGFNISDQCLPLEFADQDRLLLGALGNNCVTIWDMTTGIVREIAGWTEDLITLAYASLRPISAKFCPDATLLAVLYTGEDIVLWDLELDGEYTIFSRGAGAEVICVAFSNANNKYFVASYRDGDLVLFDRSEFQIVRRILANAQVMTCSPDGRTLACGDLHGNISIFDFEGLELLYRIRTDGCIQRLEFSGDGRCLLDMRERQCHIWSPEVFLRPDLSAEDSGYASVSLAPAQEVKCAEYGSPANITSIAIYGDREHIFVGKGDGSVSLFDANCGKQLRTLFSLGRVISLHFDNASDTLISLDDSGRVMIHHCTDFAETSEELKPSFDQEFSEAIRQVLGNIGHTRLLVSSSLKDMLWTISSNGNLITKTIEWKNRESFRWASHPSQQDKLVLLIGSVLHFYEWSTLNRLTGPQGIPLELTRPPAVNIKAIMLCFGDNFFATLFSDVTAPHCNLRGFLWDTSDFPEDLTSPFQTQPYCILDEGVRHLIGYYGRNLVYLTHDGWI